MNYNGKEIVITAKLTPSAKRKAAQRQIDAFRKARAAKQRYFYLNGKWYTTQKKERQKNSGLIVR